jgi:hypothetical protein
MKTLKFTVEVSTEKGTNVQALIGLMVTLLSPRLKRGGVTLVDVTAQSEEGH